MTSSFVGEWPHLLLVHGAWHGSWCWTDVASELTAHGWRVSAVDLPSASADGTSGMYDDAHVLRERLEALEGAVSVVAHSYGGVPLTQAAAGMTTVSQLIYVAGYMLDEGESVANIVGLSPSEDDGATLPPPSNPREALFGDVSMEEAVGRQRGSFPRAFGPSGSL